MIEPDGLVQIVVPTTEGPVAVVELARERAELEDAFALVHGSTEIAGISPEYAALLGNPASGLAQRFGHRAWRLELSANIDSGRSWESGIVLAHALENSDRLARGNSDLGATIVWITGSLRSDDLEIGPVEHIDEKLQTSLIHLQQWVALRRRVLLVAPKSSWEQVDPARLDELTAQGIEIHACNTFDDAARLVRVSLPPRPIPTTTHRAPVAYLALAALSLTGLIGAFGLYTLLQRDPLSPIRPSC